MAAAAEQVKQPQPPAITMSRFSEAGYSRNIFCVTAEPSTSIEEILHQKYWQHVAHMLKAGDRIEVMDDKMSYFLELVVIGAERLWAHVGVLRKIDLTSFRGQEIPVDENLYRIEHAGSHHKWRVLYEGEVMKDGFETEGLARRWASNHSDARTR